MTDIGEGVSVAVDVEKKPSPGKLKVKVVDKCTYAPVEGAEVKVGGWFPTTMTTDANGIADFGEMEPDTYAVKVKKHFTEADYFLFLSHGGLFPRITWSQKAVSESVGSVTLPEGGRVESVLKIKVFRVVDQILFKRLHLELSSLEYGHWWTDLGGGESYGWWPESVFSGPALSAIIDTFMGVPGALNGMKADGSNDFSDTASLTRDPHHADDRADVDEMFSAVISDCRTDEDLKKIARRFAKAYSGRWSWRFEFGNHCHTFQIGLMDKIAPKGYRDS